MSRMLLAIATLFLITACSNEPTATVPQPMEQIDQPQETNSTPPPKEENIDLNTQEEQSQIAYTKDEYLKILNTQEEADKNKEVTDTTTIGLIAEETERYETWDKLLNEIYGVLKTQLTESEMKKLQEEQREWIVYRDATAKESSLKYEGGTMEKLEYVATQATLTRERCYELVAKYMK